MISENVPWLQNDLADSHSGLSLNPESVPALVYHWDFGDGISAQGPSAEHAYTRNGAYKIALQVEGLDGIAATNTSAITIQGSVKTAYDVENSQIPGTLNPQRVFA